MSDHTPTELHLHQRSKILEIAFENERFRLSCEYLRVYSPSAEVMGHGPGQETLQIGKEDVAIDAIEPIGHYAIKLVFSDGHDTGIYSWDYLYELGQNYTERWNDYLQRLEQAGVTRQVLEN